MNISRKLAIQILEYCRSHKEFYFPFSVMCKEYLETDYDLAQAEIDEYNILLQDTKYQTFELSENLQDLHKETVNLMAKGFIEKITGESLESHISILAKNYRKDWKEELWKSERIEEFGLNEFIGGKADAYEDCLYLIKKYHEVI